MPDVRRHGERGDRAFSRADVEENLRYADASTASEEEDRFCYEKEIANANADSENDAIVNRRGKEENKRVADSVAPTKEKTFAISKSDRNANANCGAECFAASKEEGFANDATV
jgi:hypothetical protein